MRLLFILLLIMLISPLYLEEPEKEELVIAVPPCIDSLNPLTARTQLGWILSILTTDTLLKPGKLFFYYYEVDPWQVTSWKELNNYTAWIIVLRSGMKWSDGSEVSIDDLKYTFELLKDSEVLPWHILLRDLKSVTILNDTALILNFTRPIPYLPRLMVALPLINEVEVKSVGSLRAIRYFNITVGPYKVVSWTKEELVFEANEYYPMGKLRFSKIRIIFVNDTTLVKSLLNNNRIDGAINAISPFELKYFINDAQYNIMISSGLSLYLLVMNPRRGYLQELKFRDALVKAINVTRILLEVFNGYADITRSYIPLYFIPPRGVSRYVEVLKDAGLHPEFDKAAARKALLELGFHDMDGDEILEDRRGKEVVLQLVIYKEDSILRELGNVIVQELRDIGIEVKLVMVDLAEYIERLYFKRDFDLAIFEMPYFTFPAPDYIALLGYSYAGRPGGINLASLKLDQLSESILFEYNLTRKLQKSIEFEIKLYEQRIYLPLLTRPIIGVCLSKKGLRNSIMGFLFPSSLLTKELERGWIFVPLPLIRMLVNLILVIIAFAALYVVHELGRGLELILLRP